MWNAALALSVHVCICVSERERVQEGGFAPIHVNICRRKHSERGCQSSKIWHRPEICWLKCTLGLSRKGFHSLDRGCLLQNEKHEMWFLHPSFHSVPLLHRRSRSFLFTQLPFFIERSNRTAGKSIRTDYTTHSPIWFQWTLFELNNVWENKLS